MSLQDRKQMRFHAFLSGEYRVVRVSANAFAKIYIRIGGVQYCFDLSSHAGKNFGTHISPAQQSTSFQRLMPVGFLSHTFDKDSPPVFTESGPHAVFLLLQRAGMLSLELMRALF